ncbi:MAG: DinB family protein [Bryobacteraceae bacterium]
MRIAETITSELEREAVTTRNLLALVPTDQLTWKPCGTSMSLGVLANHIATLPGGIATVGAMDGLDLSNLNPPAPPESTAAVLAAFDEGVAKAKATIDAMGDEALMANWSLTKGGNAILTVPRMGLFRSILLNHLYHHRGQLSVYLRILGIRMPSIYGPSADENPFA